VTVADEGLTFHPSPYDPPLGYAGFDVALGDAPSARYFDARRLSFPIEVDGVLKRGLVEHPWGQSPELRFAAGRIRLDAHDDDHMELFGFGGVATITTTGGVTLCQVTSSAPLLPLTDDPNDPLALLESELEVMIAQDRARWGADEYSHLDRLGHVAPLTLFAASFTALERRLRGLAAVEDDVRQALRLVRGIREIVQRAGAWPDNAPDWEELL
jgi:hypothetical protein